MSDVPVEAPDPHVADLVRSSVAALKTVERNLAELRVAGTWQAPLRQSLERLALAFSGVMEAVDDPRFPLSFDAASAEQFSQTANGLQATFNNYPNDVPNIVPGAWQQVAALGSIVRGAFVGSLRGRPSPDAVVLEAAVGRLQRLLSDFRAAESQLGDLGARQISLSQEAAALMATMNSQFLEQQRVLEREWREALKLERDTVSTERDTVRAEVENLKLQNKALHDAFATERAAAIAALDAARNGTVERLTDYERQAREALGAVGSTAQSAQYQATAEGAASRRYWWQMGAIVCMSLAAVALLLFIFLDPSAVEFSVGAAVGMAKRALFVALLGILSRYCAAMADGARSEQLWAHQRAVELRALAPYLEPFPEPDRLKLRERLVDKYFGVGSTLLAEAGTKGVPATGTHDVVMGTLTALFQNVSPEVLSQLLAAVVAAKKPVAKEGSTR